VVGVSDHAAVEIAKPTKPAPLRTAARRKPQTVALRGRCNTRLKLKNMIIFTQKKTGPRL